MPVAVCMHIQGFEYPESPSSDISWYSRINTVPVHPFIAFFIIDGIYDQIKSMVLVSNLNVMDLKTFIMQTHHWSQIFYSIILFTFCNRTAHVLCNICEADVLEWKQQHFKINIYLGDGCYKLFIMFMALNNFFIMILMILH